MENAISGAATEDNVPEFKSPPMSVCDTSVQSSPRQGSSPSEGDTTEDVFLPSISVSISQATGTVLHTTVNSADMPLPPTLKGMREMLLSSEIADESYDIFFPKWTFTMIMLIKTDDQEDVVKTVETDEHLLELLNRERYSSGTVSIKLEQCKNIKYSRFQPIDTLPLSSFHVGSSLVSSQVGLRHGQEGSGKFWKRKNNTKSQKPSLKGPISPANNIHSPVRMSPDISNEPSYLDGPAFYGHRQIDPRYQFWGSAGDTKGLHEYPAHSTHGSTSDAYGTGMQYRFAPVVMPSHPVCYPGMGYWAFAPVAQLQHYGATFYYNYTPYMMPSANMQCF